MQRQDFAWLGILPEDVPITPLMTATLWEIDERSARDQLRVLHNKALLMRSSHRDTDQESPFRYRLHDLAHDMARKLLKTSPEPLSTDKLELNLPGLGLSFSEAHSILLKRYRTRTQNGLWHTLPDDGYIHAHLTWHLEKAELIDELHALLQEKNSEGKSGWFQLCQKSEQDGSQVKSNYLQDVSRAWRLAEETYNNNEIPQPQMIGLQCRYALIVASLSTLAQNIPPTMVAALVKEKIWTPTQGLAFARQIPNPMLRIQALELLSDYLEESAKNGILQEALMSTRAITDEESRAQALTNLMPKVSGPLIQVILEIVLEIEREEIRITTLTQLALQLRQNYPQEALSITQEIEDGDKRLQILLEIAPDLPKADQLKALQFAKQLAKNMEDPTRIEALKKVIREFAKYSHFQDALITVQQDIDNKILQLDILSEIAPYMSNSEQEQLLCNALAAACKIEHKSYQTEVLIKWLFFLLNWDTIKPLKRQYVR